MLQTCFFLSFSLTWLLSIISLNVSFMPCLFLYFSAVCCYFFKFSVLGIHSRQQKLRNVSKKFLKHKKDLQDVTQNPKSFWNQEKYFNFTTVQSKSEIWINNKKKKNQTSIRCLQYLRQRRCPAIQRHQLLLEVQLPVPPHQLHSQPGGVSGDHPAGRQRVAGPCWNNRQQSAHSSAERQHPSRGWKVGAPPLKHFFFKVSAIEI